VLEDLKLAREVTRKPLFKDEWNDPRAVQSDLTPGGWAIRPWRELLGRGSSKVAASVPSAWEIFIE
jgi:hypothetical protein